MEVTEAGKEEAVEAGAAAEVAVGLQAGVTRAAREGLLEAPEDEEHQQTLREEIERKYYPARYDFWPFGDPFINKRKREATKRRQQGQRQWYDED